MPSLTVVIPRLHPWWYGALLAPEDIRYINSKTHISYVPLAGTGSPHGSGVALARFGSVCHLFEDVVSLFDIGCSSLI